MKGHAAPKPLDNMQTLKGLGCILVVAHHVIGGHFGGGLNLAPTTFLGQFSQAIELLRMPLFAFISGYVYSMRPVAAGGYLPFLGKKFSRLYLPIIAVGFLYFSLRQLSPGFEPESPQTLLQMLVYPYGHFWFIQALIAILALAGVLEMLGLFRTPGRFAPVLLGSVFIQLFDTSDLQFFSLGRAGYLLPFFLLGIGVQDRKSTRLNSSHRQ